MRTKYLSYSHSGERYHTEVELLVCTFDVCAPTFFPADLQKYQLHMLGKCWCTHLLLILIQNGGIKRSAGVVRAKLCNSGVANSIIEGYIFMYSSSQTLKIDFKRLIVQNMNIWICAPPPPPPQLSSLLRHCFKSRKIDTKFVYLLVFKFFVSNLTCCVPKFSPHIYAFSKVKLPDLDRDLTVELILIGCSNTLYYDLFSFKSKD